MLLFDWRDIEPSRLRSTWVEQNARWSERLFWDASANWAQVEAQRQAGRLPGFALLHGDQVRAWSCFLVHQDSLQIGGFESDSSSATRTLLDAVLAAADPAVAPSGAMLFAFSAAPGLVPALVARGFDTEPYLHLVRDLAAVRPATPTVPWDMQAAAHLPSLFARAYGAPTPARPFARHGLMEEWREYAGQLLGSVGCGAFAPALSAASFTASGTLQGTVVTTRVGPGTAHIAQVAVDPRKRGSGLATEMVQSVIERARADGFERVSLLVSERNAAARRLYERLGFHETASFIAAGRTARAFRTTSAAGRRSSEARM